MPFETVQCDKRKGPKIWLFTESIPHFEATTKKKTVEKTTIDSNSSSQNTVTKKNSNNNQIAAKENK